MKIAVASGKGGTGKTTLAVNLAAFMAEKQYFSDMILADLDVEEPNSGIFITGRTIDSLVVNKSIPEWQQEKCTLCGQCERLCRFNAVMKFGKTIMTMPELCHSCYACSELCPEEALPMTGRRMGMIKNIEAEGFKFIESRLDIGQEQAVPLIAESAGYITERYSASAGDASLVIFDSPPGSSCPVMEVAKNSDYILLVTEPTPFGLHDLKMAVDSMKQLEKKFGVIVNRWGIGNDEVVEYCRENGIELIARIPNIRRIAELYSEGRLVYNEVPEFRSALEDVAVFILKLSGSYSL